MGSKERIAKYILPVMLSEREPGQWWVEPFVGRASIISRVAGNRIGNDINEYLIALLTAVRDGYIPPTNISKDEYYAIKKEPHKYPKELVGFVGFACSFGGKWFGGYISDSKGRNYAEEGSRSLVKLAKGLAGVVFKSGSYLDLEIPKSSLIYCDPPYANVTEYEYSKSKNFDHDAFWEWCRIQAKKGHTVFVSEYSAPEDFVCVREIRHEIRLNNRNVLVPRVEKLFRYKG